MSSSTFLLFPDASTAAFLNICNYYFLLFSMREDGYTAHPHMYLFNPFKNSYYLGMKLSVCLVNLNL